MRLSRHQVKTLTGPAERRCGCTDDRHSLHGHRPPTAPASYEAALAELEGSSRRWKAASCRSRSRSPRYQRGAELLAFCRATLEDAQQQVKVLEEGELKRVRARRRDEATTSTSTTWARERQRARRARARALRCPRRARDAPRLGEAMRYAVLDGGKRLRPLLVLRRRRGAGAEPRGRRLRAAAAVELIHAYSLVHDDLPCMDDDVLRRGKPTVHVQFGEAQALLAGDALQALAFEVLTPRRRRRRRRCRRGCARCWRARPARAGMAGGQAIDLASVGRRARRARRCATCTGARPARCCRRSVLMGAACGARSTPASWQRARRDYGAAVGLAFQVVDDILDVTQADPRRSARPPARTRRSNKPTYVSAARPRRRARARAPTLRDEAHARARAAAACATRRPARAGRLDRRARRIERP